MGDEKLMERIATMQRDLLAMQTELQLRRLTDETADDLAEETPVDQPPIGAAKQYPTPAGETVGVWGDRYPGFLGKAATDGVLRADTTGLDYLYVAGNDFVTVGHKDTSTVSLTGGRKAVATLDTFGHVTAVASGDALTTDQLPNGSNDGDTIQWDTGTGKWVILTAPSNPAVRCFNAAGGVWVSVPTSTQTVYSDGTDMIADDLRAGA